MSRKALFVLRLFGQDIKNNLAVHGLALAIISASFLTVGLFLLGAANLKALERHWQAKVKLCVYLEDGLDSAELSELEGKLRKLPQVEAISFTDKDAALSEFRAMLGKDAALLEGLEENPLPMSFTLSLQPSARDWPAVEDLAKKLEKWPGVDEVDYGQEWLSGFSQTARLVEAAVFLVSGLILVAIVFIISNTIRLSMFSRREEIAIMKLVGAGNLIIRVPFILEGMLQAALACGIGLGLLWLGFKLVLEGAAWPGPLSGFSPVFFSTTALWVMVAGAAGLGAAGSISRVSDFLKV